MRKSPPHRSVGPLVFLVGASIATAIALPDGGALRAWAGPAAFPTGTVPDDALALPLPIEPEPGTKRPSIQPWAGEVIPSARPDADAAVLAMLVPMPRPKPDYHKLNPYPDLPPSASIDPPKDAKRSLHRLTMRGEAVPLAAVLLAAIERSPDVAIARARREVAAYASDIAESGLKPQVSSSVSSGPELTWPQGEKQVIRNREQLGLQLTQLLYDGGVTRYDVRRAEALEDSARASIRAEFQSLALEVAEAVISLKESDQLIAHARSNIAAHEDILELVKLRYDAGSGTEADVQRVDAKLARARSEIVDLEGRFNQAEDRYRRLVGELPGLVEHPPEPEPLLPASELDAIDVARLRNPQLVALLRDSESLRMQIRSNRGNFLPRVDLDVGGNYSDDAGGDTDVARDISAMLSLSYKLYDGGNRSAVSGQLYARVRQLTASFQKALRELEEGIRSDFTSVTGTRAKRDEILAEIRASKNVKDLYLQQFEAGQRNVFDLLDSQQDVYNAERSFTTNRYDEFRSSYAILAQMGLLIESLVPEVKPPVD